MTIDMRINEDMVRAALEASDHVASYELTRNGPWASTLSGLLEELALDAITVTVQTGKTFLARPVIQEILHVEDKDAVVEIRVLMRPADDPDGDWDQFVVWEATDKRAAPLAASWPAVEQASTNADRTRALFGWVISLCVPALTRMLERLS